MHLDTNQPVNQLQVYQTIQGQGTHSHGQDIHTHAADSSTGQPGELI